MIDRKEERDVLPALWQRHYQLEAPPRSDVEGFREVDKAFAAPRTFCAKRLYSGRRASSLEDDATASTFSRKLSRRQFRNRGDPRRTGSKP